MKNYEIIEHTADIGIRVKGKDLKGLFKNAARAMFDIIAERQKIEGETKEEAQEEKLKIEQQAENTEELFVIWLNELLSLSATKELIFSDFKINRLEANILQAVIIGKDIKNYKLNTEIKAATYHELKIEQTKSGWQAEVIFDV